MELGRRGFLLGAGAIGLAAGLPTLAACAPTPSPGRPGRFRHGVASGDPDATSVVLWTRLEDVTGPTTVAWEVSDRPDLANVVASGTATTGPARDGTVKLVADGLRPGTTYWYRFDVGGERSDVGRTRTAPVGPTARLRLGVASCSNYAFGNFHLYRYLAERSDLDAVVHLGDYTYEYATAGQGGETYGEFRALDPPNETLTLDDYRRRYALYRRDPDLAEVHRQHPFLHVWDDHEFADDPEPGGAANHQPAQDGDWRARVAAALQAYDEWMPTRLVGDRIHRSVDFGDLARLVLVDRQRKYLFPAPGDGGGHLDEPQFRWLDDTLAGTGSRWCVLGQQSVFGSRQADQSSGGWGRAARDRVHGALDAASGPGGRPDLVVVGGDIHQALAMDVPRVPGVYDRATGAGSAAVELTCGSITSPGSDSPLRSPQEHWNLGSYRTYLVVDLTPERVQADVWGFPDTAKLLARRGPEEWLTGWVSQRGANHLVSVARAVPTRGDAPPPAP